MVKKVLFPIELNGSNRYKRDYLIGRFSNYVGFSSADFLEIGIGNGRFGYLLGERVAHYYGIDIDEEYVRIAEGNIPEEANVTYKVGSAEDVPFDKQFDVIFYAQSWHFINDFQKALKEAERVLKSDGIVAILEPSENSRNWASPKLRRGSKEFDEIAFQKKLLDLERGRRAIFNQNLFEVVEDEYDARTTSYFYVLKKSNV